MSAMGDAPLAGYQVVGEETIKWNLKKWTMG
jgi:hypothetical protein